MKIHKFMTTFSIVVTYMCVGEYAFLNTHLQPTQFLCYLYICMPKIISDEKSVRVREREFSVRLSLRNARRYLSKFDHHCGLI